MKTVMTLDEFLTRAKEIIIKAAAGETGVSVTVPGASSAVIISEQEYEALKSAIDQDNAPWD